MSRTNTEPYVAMPEPVPDDSGTSAKYVFDNGQRCRPFVDDSLSSLALPTHKQKYFSRKYAAERLLGLILLVLFTPATLLLFALVKLTSRGPGFYWQKRVGLNGRTFQMIKLRSMVFDAEKPGEAVWCAVNDNRITPLGRVLRKLHLDELPQLWNVARGEMALVGPRPERPQICCRLAEQIDGYYERTLVKPGITGLAQINLPPDHTIEDAARKQILDVLYIKQAHWWLDTRMLLATGMRMFGIKGETVMKMMRLCRRDVIRTIPNHYFDDTLEEFEAADSDVQETALAFAEVSVRRPR